MTALPPSAYEERALRGALEDGLTPGDLRALLQGRLATDLVAPHVGEDPALYADRAAGEFLLLYLGLDPFPA